MYSRRIFFFLFGHSKGYLKKKKNISKLATITKNGNERMAGNKSGHLSKFGRVLCMPKKEETIKKKARKQEKNKERYRKNIENNAGYKRMIE